MDIKLINNAIKLIIHNAFNIPLTNITISHIPSQYLAKQKWNYAGTFRFDTFKYSIYWIKTTINNKVLSQAYIIEENL